MRDLRSLPLAARAGPLRHTAAEKSVDEAEAETRESFFAVARGGAFSGVSACPSSLAAAPSSLPLLLRCLFCCFCACLRLGGVEGTGVVSSSS